MENLQGKKFGYLTAIEFSHKDQNRKTYWKCLCDCGNQKTARSDSLKSGNDRSCGCLKKEQDKINLTKNHSHKKSGTRIYETWQGMKGRCYNSREACYERYGGRGVKVCDEWRESFESFYRWAVNNGYSDGLTIDRIDNAGIYSPENCTFSDARKQARNRRSNVRVNIRGKEMILIEVAENYGINYGCISARYHRGDRGERLIRPMR